jgi:cytoskeletal protein RodZ
MSKVEKFHINYCVNNDASLVLFLQSPANRQTPPMSSREGREMSIAVPVILAVALAVSLYGQIGWEWPNYQNEQNEQNEKSKKSDEESSKEKSEKKDESSSEKGKSGQKNKFGKASASKGRRDAGPRRQE